jgi:predicted transcriptional regulator of viral defense system
MRGWELELAMRELAKAQHGVISCRQARGLSSSADALRWRLRSPGWARLTSQVFCLAGTPPTFSQRCIVAVLDIVPAGVVSRTAAAAVWGLPGFKPVQVHVTRANDASSRANTRVSVHESRYLPRHHWTLVDGIPVTTVARTVFDLASCVVPEVP